MLSIFSLLILHQTFPHEHHQHEDIAIEKHHGDDDEHHHNHHHRNEDGEDGPSGLLEFLLGNHVHTYHIHDLVIRNLAKRQVEAKIFSPVAISENGLPLFEEFEDRVGPPPYVQLIYDPFLYSSAVPRGPPALGKSSLMDYRSIKADTVPPIIY